MQLLTGATLAALSDEQVESLNQYLYRFIKLQDAMGMRLFAQTLTLLAENVRGMPFIDQLSRLEQLGALESAQLWLELRQLRNLLTHEHACSVEEKASAINLVFGHYPTLERLLSGFKIFIEPRL